MGLPLLLTGFSNLCHYFLPPDKNLTANPNYIKINQIDPIEETESAVFRDDNTL